MNFSVLDFFRFTSRMPQIAQILVSTFKIFRGGIPLDPPRNFFFFNSLAVPGSDSELSIYHDYVCVAAGDPKCPVRSFLKYVEHLHPMTDAFWQRPKRNVCETDYVWYDHSPMGTSTLNRIMQRISLMAGMYESYTNHSIRAAYIPLIENMCAEALSLGSRPILVPARSMTESSGGGSISSSVLQSQDSRAEPEFSSGDDSSSVTSEHKDVDDGDVADPKSKWTCCCF